MWGRLIACQHRGPPAAKYSALQFAHNLAGNLAGLSSSPGSKLIAPTLACPPAAILSQMVAKIVLELPFYPWIRIHPKSSSEAGRTHGTV